MENIYDDFGNIIPTTTTTMSDISSPSSSDEEISFKNDKINVIITSSPMELDPVDILHQDEDTQSIQEPILKTEKPLSIFYSKPSISFPPSDNDSKEELSSDYDPSFIASLLTSFDGPDRNTIISLVGTIHSGKTSLLDLVYYSQHWKERSIFYSNKENSSSSKENGRLLDRFTLEKKRGVTLHLKTITIPITVNSKTSTIQFIDTPGHSDFYQDVLNGLEVSDRRILVIDAAQGITKQTEALIHHLKGEKFTIIINKIDRLILELRLTPLDSYMKLLFIIQSINEIIGKEEEEFSPLKGNVLFASSLHGYLFSIQSFLSSTLSPKEIGDFSPFLWGSYYHSPEDGSITLQAQKKKGPSSKPTFVTWILEPLYKLYNSALTETPLEGIKLSQNSSSFLSKIRQTMASFLSSKKIDERGLQGSTFMKQFHPLLKMVGRVEEEDIVKELPSSSSSSLIIKAYPVDRNTFEYLVRTPKDLRIGDLFLDQYVITHIFLPLGLSKIKVSQVKSDTLALLIFDNNPLLKNNNIDLPFSISIETINPSLDESLSKALQLMIGNFYTASTFIPKKDGRYDISGPGEFYFDSFLSDLRTIFQLPLRLSIPTPIFRESIADMSGLIVHSDPLTSSGIYISMIAEPLKKEGLDALSIRSILSQNNSNYLIDDRMDKGYFPFEEKILNILIETFTWTCGEGPLLKANMMGVVFRLVDLVEGDNDNGGSDRVKDSISIPVLRRCFHSLLLVSRPTILEPLLLLEIIATRPDELSSLTNGSIRDGEEDSSTTTESGGKRPQIKDLKSLFNELLQRRRGHLVGEMDLSSTPQTSFLAIVPYLDYLGMEVDIRVSTLGLSHPQSIILGRNYLKNEDDNNNFPSYQMVSGDPLDWRLDSRYSLLMEPAPAPYLSRDIMLKERRRNGLNNEVLLIDLFSQKTLDELKKNDLYKDLGMDLLFNAKKRN